MMPRDASAFQDDIILRVPADLNRPPRREAPTSGRHRSVAVTAQAHMQSRVIHQSLVVLSRRLQGTQFFGERKVDVLFADDGMLDGRLEAIDECV